MKLTKMDAMRQVLKKLGDDAPTTVLQAELKASFGVEMTTKNIATYRADIIKKRPAAEPPRPATAGGNGAAGVSVDSVLEDVLAVRGLVARIGAERLRTLIDAFEQ